MKIQIDDLSRERREREKEIERLKKQIDTYSKKSRTYEIGAGKENTLIVGVVSDTHLGSSCERLDALKKFYGYCRELKIKTVLHAGDVTCGDHVYPGQEYEVIKHGYDEQRDHVIKNYPYIKGITTYFITGNHDASFKKRAGATIGDDIALARKDMKFLGEDYADIVLTTDGGFKYKVALVHPDGGTAYSLCFDDKTEVMTKTGWKFFKDLTYDDCIATLNPKNHNFEWQKPDDIINEDYSGKLIHFKDRCFDLLVTPNHRMFVRKYPKRLKRKIALKYPKKSHGLVDSNWSFKEASELASGGRQEWQMTKVSTGWVGKKTNTVKIPHRLPKKFATHKIKHFGELRIEDVAELISWYVTEGSIEKYKNCGLSICQSERVNPENHKKIQQLFERIGLNCSIYGRDRKDIMVHSTELCDFLLKECGSGSANKFLPQWLKDQTEDILRIVFDTMIKGDGWIKGSGFGYRSISRQLLSDLAEVAIKLGYGVTFTGDQVVSISTVQVYPTINNKPKEVAYDGKVYCARVKNGILFVRRNGKTIWSGNSYRSQKYVESLSGGQKPAMVCMGHYHKAEIMPDYRNVVCIQAGCFESQTGFMKRRGLAAHVGGWIVEITNGKLSRKVKTEWVGFYEPEDT